MITQRYTNKKIKLYKYTYIKLINSPYKAQKSSCVHAVIQSFKYTPTYLQTQPLFDHKTNHPSLKLIKATIQNLKNRPLTTK